MVITDWSIEEPSSATGREAAEPETNWKKEVPTTSDEHSLLPRERHNHHGLRRMAQATVGRMPKTPHRVEQGTDLNGVRHPLLLALTHAYLRHFPLAKGKRHVYRALIQPWVDEPASAISSVGSYGMLQLDLSDPVQEMYLFGVHEQSTVAL